MEYSRQGGCPAPLDRRRAQRAAPGYPGSGRGCKKQERDYLGQISQRGRYLLLPRDLLREVGERVAGNHPERRVRSQAPIARSTQPFPASPGCRSPVGSCKRTEEPTEGPKDLSAYIYECFYRNVYSAVIAVATTVRKNCARSARLEANGFILATAGRPKS